MKQSAVEWLEEELKANLKKVILEGDSELMESLFEQAKEMDKKQRGYSESDMRSYASYILNNPVIEPSQWYKIYRTKSE